MFDPTPAPFALLQRVCSATRAQACAAAERLVAIGELFSLRMLQAAETEDWAADATDAVTAEIAAALKISHQLAGSHLHYARALRELVPLVGRAFIAGDIDEATFKAVVFRTGLITDPEVLAEVDRTLSVSLPRWGSSNRAQLNHRIDGVVATADLDAVRRRADRVAERGVVIGEVDNGLTEITATVYASDGRAVAERLAGLAATVCAADPRTFGQRRADAFAALAAGADRLGCRCGSEECPAGGKTASAVVIHVIAERATIDGSGQTPGVVIGGEGLIPAELVAELAKSARLRPLIHPSDCAPEASYTPSRALADFVRCRDLTCRFPGCSRPATKTDIDHTVPHAQGGPTRASNLKCLCRLHHLLKTFWGWRDRQLADGTIVWSSPAGDAYVTHPGSALTFPALCTPADVVRVVEVPRAVATETGLERTAMMPRRRRTRERERAAAIATERRRNHRARTAPRRMTVDEEYDEQYEIAFGLKQRPIPPPF